MSGEDWFRACLAEKNRPDVELIFLQGLIVERAACLQPKLEAIPNFDDFICIEFDAAVPNGIALENSFRRLVGVLRVFELTDL